MTKRKLTLRNTEFLFSLERGIHSAYLKPGVETCRSSSYSPSSCYHGSQVITMTTDVIWLQKLCKKPLHNWLKKKRERGWLMPPPHFILHLPNTAATMWDALHASLLFTLSLLFWINHLLKAEKGCYNCCFLPEPERSFCVFETLPSFRIVYPLATACLMFILCIMAE